MKINSKSLKIKVSDYHLLDIDQKKVVTALTLRGRGGSTMREGIANIKKNPNLYHKCILVELEGKIVAWALILDKDLTLYEFQYHINKISENTVHCMFYVSVKYRKKGIGACLAKQAIRQCLIDNKNPYVSYWSNEGFFNKLNFQLNGTLKNK